MKIQRRDFTIVVLTKQKGGERGAKWTLINKNMKIISLYFGILEGPFCGMVKN